MRAPSRLLVGTVLLLLLSATSARATAAAETRPSPRPWLNKIIERGEALAKRPVKAGSDGEPKWQAEAKDLINEALDWNGLTEQALGKQWSKLAPPEQQEFTRLLREMVEASYQSKLKLLASGNLKKPAQVKIEWMEEKQEGDEASVTARVKSDKNVAVLEFKLSWKGDRWRVWDVSIDEVSTVRTYRTQFTKIIAKDGFAALVERMKSKTDEIRAGRAELTP